MLENLGQGCSRVQLTSSAGGSVGELASMSNKSLWSASQSGSILFSARVPKLSSCLSGLPGPSASPSLPGCIPLLLWEPLLDLQDIPWHHQAVPITTEGLAERSEPGGR